MFPRLRVLAAFFLLPVALVFSNPTMAHAATTGTMSFTLSAGGNLLPANCKLPWARTSTGVSIGATSYCVAGADFTPGFCQPYEGSCGSFGVVIKNTSGGTCGGAALTPFSNDRNTVGSVAAGLGAAFIALPDTSCVPSSVCLSYFFQPPRASILAGIQTVDEVDCIAWTDPKPPPTGGWEPPAELPFGSCLWGTPQAVATEHVNTWDGLNKDRIRLLFFNRYPEPTDGLGLEWGFDLAHGAVSVTPYMSTNGTNVYGNDNNPTWVSTTLWKNAPTGLGGSHPTGEGAVWGVQVTTLHTNTRNANGGVKFGYTNPEKCSFYFGPKIRNGDDPVFGDDTPWGPMTPYPEQPTPTPEPDPVPPTEVPTDAPDADTGLLSGLLGILNKIWSAITGIVSGVVNGIIDGFKTLFIPDKGFMNDAFSDTKAQWEGTAVLKFANVFDDITFGSVSMCSGLPLNVTMPGGTQINESIGAACFGPMATTAGIVRNVVNCIIFVGGAIACLRGIGAGFGWRPSIGRQDV